ncbi:MAG: hypothetical protein AAF432_02755 [Planctomycetota bacterium]
MITPRLRPRIERTVAMPAKDVTSRMTALLESAACPCEGLVLPASMELRVRESDRHFWSPQLKVIVHETVDGTSLTGHFGPNSNVWTMFMAAYGMVIISAIFGVFFGLSQVVLGDSPTGLLCIPIAIVLVVLIYVAAGIGQRVGYDQTTVLRDALDASLDHARPQDDSP